MDSGVYLRSPGPTSASPLEGHRFTLRVVSKFLNGGAHHAAKNYLEESWFSFTCRCSIAYLRLWQRERRWHEGARAKHPEH